MARRQVLYSLVVLLFGIGLFPAASDGGQAAGMEDAGAFLASLTERAVEQLTDESLAPPERKQRFRVLFRENFDVPAIGRFVLGRYWCKAKPPVREEFLRLFEDIMVERFAPKFTSYAETTFEVGVIRPLREQGQHVVASKFTPSRGEVLHVDWRVRNKDGRFKILDVIGQGVSMALTLRSEYASVIKSSGGRVEDLVARLRERIESDPDTQTTSSTAN